MIVVGMMSTYKEGSLCVAAVKSLLNVGLDALYVYEGPAGDPLPDEVPDSELAAIETLAGREIIVHRGRWRTDGRKRNDMLQRAKADYPGIAWGVVLDGDEVLGNAEYLRDRLQALLWDDEERSASIATPDNAPISRWPLRLIEADGGISFITARVFRLDLVRSIDHSSSVITNVSGIQEGWGNYQEMSSLWLEVWLRAIDNGKMVAWPPLPCEPHIVHRSNLRHPLRRSLRMSDQETVEFAKAQARVNGG